jgi:hypothetical protein
LEATLDRPKPYRIVINMAWILHKL